jgi:hypothetical protein
VTQARLLFHFASVACIVAEGAEIVVAADALVIKVKGLPEDALIIEQQKLPETSHANRALVLWMEHPIKNDRRDLSGAQAEENQEPYTCPEVTRGNFYRGPTRVSLLDSRSGNIINTIRIVVELTNHDEDSFDFRI